MFEGLNERSPIHFQNERERKIFKNCNEVNNIWKTTSCVYLAYKRVAWAPNKQRKCKVVAEESVRRVLSLNMREFCNWLVLSYFAYSGWLLLTWDVCSSFWDVCRRSKIFPFPSYLEASSYFEEEMVSTFGGRSLLTPISANGWYKFLCILPLISNISPDSVYISCWT